MTEQRRRAARTARNYYDTADADNFYRRLWGGEDIHLGLYGRDDVDIYSASRRTIAAMAAMLPALDADKHILDLGAGYGGSARWLAREYACRVTALNISHRENTRNLRLTDQQNLEDRIQVLEGSFEDVPIADGSIDVVWSQDALLHSGDRPRVLSEAVRVLEPGGHLIFTDPMQADDARGGLEPILARLQLQSMGSREFYEQTLAGLGMRLLRYDDHSDMVARHYGAVLEALITQRESLQQDISSEYLERMAEGLRHWIAGGQQGLLHWGIYLFRKPDFPD
ncbi:sarcosine/dimethylglycine N-methyltransferase [Natronocella acetinitrilica]|uniref:Sarcosine/dimethylglycine N-methyltransferase n=1 Tax=Natronocella acetinitrilica TaxID=414046 RepID=A0AAE3KAV1_9GAMM|nr:class I SAM-dependent methyltransferase [Natronocella acetinitrilica]MCP1674029.1 sarcosine/dimethylglycine N-methyltransferase [Natronocella acetinitrilica]